MFLLISDSFWTFLTAERAFLARAFVDHCCANNNAARLEETLPVVTALAFRIQEAYNSLAERVGELEEQRLFLRSESKSDILSRYSLLTSPKISRRKKKKRLIESSSLPKC